MLEHESDIILKTLIERTIGEKTSFHLDEALQSDIPRSVKAYLQAEVEHWIDGDLRSTPTFARIDDQAAQHISHVTNTFLRAVSGSYKFTHDEFVAALENAVHFVENYLCRPQWTLEHFLFDQGDTLLLFQLRSKLKYLTEYRYFPTVLERVARERDWTEIRRAELRTVIERIDGAVVRQHSPRELANLARPIFEFLSAGREPSLASIPLAPLLLFFDDKKLFELRTYIESVCRIRRAHAITMDELAGIVEDFYPSTPETKVEPPQETTLPQADIPSVAVEPLPPASGTEGIPPEVHEVAHEEPREQEPDTATPPPSELPQEPAPRDTWVTRQNVHLTLTYSGLRPPEGAQSLPDLFVMISAEQHRYFASILFRGDDPYYAGIVAGINGIASWKEASLYLSKLYETNGLDPASSEVIEFTNIVHRRYSLPGNPAE